MIVWLYFGSKFENHVNLERTIFFSNFVAFTVHFHCFLLVTCISDDLSCFTSFQNFKYVLAYSASQIDCIHIFPSCFMASSMMVGAVVTVVLTLQLRVFSSIPILSV